MSHWVDITFDCLPLRTIGRLDIPLDASPKYRARCEKIKQAIDKHGAHNTYFLYNAKCAFHLANHDDAGLIEFSFEGVVLTDADDLHAQHCDLEVELVRETCDWLTEPVVKWFALTVSRSVAIEFDRYIEAGDLEQAKRRIARIQAASDESGGYMGMYL
jgi:hypothetical protein